jgi:hypothetical protein
MLKTIGPPFRMEQARRRSRPFAVLTYWEYALRVNTKGSPFGMSQAIRPLRDLPSKLRPCWTDFFDHSRRLLISIFRINRNFGGVDGSWRIGSAKVEVKSEKQEKRPVFCFFLTPHASLLTFPFSLLTLCRRSCANRDPEQRHLGVQLICEASSLFQRWHIHVAYPEDAPS